MTYVFFDPDFEGPNNLRLSLTFALTLARLLNRTLVLPPPLPVLHWDWGARPSEPPLTSHSATDLLAVWDVDALRRVAPTLAYAEFVDRERDRLLRGAPTVLLDATLVAPRPAVRAALRRAVAWPSICAARPSGAAFLRRAEAVCGWGGADWQQAALEHRFSAPLSATSPHAQLRARAAAYAPVRRRLLGCTGALPPDGSGLYPRRPRHARLFDCATERMPRVVDALLTRRATAAGRDRLARCWPRTTAPGARRSPTRRCARSPRPQSPRYKRWPAGFVALHLRSVYTDPTAAATRSRPSDARGAAARLPRRRRRRRRVRCHRPPAGGRSRVGARRRNCAVGRRWRAPPSAPLASARAAHDNVSWARLSGPVEQMVAAAAAAFVGTRGSTFRGASRCSRGERDRGVAGRRRGARVGRRRGGDERGRRRARRRRPLPQHAEAGGRHAAAAPLRRGADAANGAARARRGERRAEAAAAVAHEPRRQPEAERGELGVRRERKGRGDILYSRTVRRRAGQNERVALRVAVSGRRASYAASARPLRSEPQEVGPDALLEPAGLSRAKVSNTHVWELFHNLPIRSRTPVHCGPRGRGNVTSPPGQNMNR